MRAGALFVLPLLLPAGCRVPRPLPPELLPSPDATPRAGEPPRGVIVACGRRIPVDAPVVLWTDPDGYDATRCEPRFAIAASLAEDGPRYRPGRVPKHEGDLGGPVVAPGSEDLDALRAVVTQFVLHYDVCGTSRRCFEVLQDRRGLSVHFLLDVDGTIYQTLDLRDTAWHAARANYRSIGVEIANIGAYPPGPKADEVLGRWYAREGGELVLRLPDAFGAEGVRTPGFRGRAARRERIRDAIHGRLLEQVDFTPEQYDSLVALTAALCRTFPGIRPDAPRDGAGRVRSDALSERELVRFGGILGHQHVTERKVDPGPAFDWDGYLARVRAALASP